MTRVYLTFLSWVLAGATGSAQPPASDDALAEKLLSGSSFVDPRKGTGASDDDRQANPVVSDGVGDREAIERITEGLTEARRLLDARETGEKTRAVQHRVVDDLDRLIKAAEAAPSLPSERGGGPRQSMEPQPASGLPETIESRAAVGTASAGEPADRSELRSRERKIEEASARAGEAPTDVIREFRSDLARDAWGHLPVRLRERILNAEGDEGLPEYDGLMRRYYESLAGAGADPGAPR